jgi:hypothetical protein
MQRRWSARQPRFCHTILLFATLVAVFSRNASRVFAMGLSIVGWLYFTIVFSGFATGVRENLLTETALNWLYSRVHASGTTGVSQFFTYRAVMPAQTYPPVPSPSFPPGSVTGYALQPVTTWNGGQQAITLTATPAAPTPAFVSPYHFAQIGHSLWVVLIGAMGGVVAQLIYARGRRQQTSGESS